MLFLNLISISLLWSVASGHVTIGESTHKSSERGVGDVHDKNTNQNKNDRTLTTKADLELQLKWVNWNICTNADLNASFTPMNSLVPNNTIFLAPYTTFIFLDNSTATCKSKTPIRTGTIPTGKQTIFFPLVNYNLLDFADDWKKGICGITFENETARYRLESGATYAVDLLGSTLQENLYLDIDGESFTPFYIYDKTFYNLSACDDDRTTMEYYQLINNTGDLCDVEPFQKIAGLDAGPLVGWFGIDTRTWANGESHTFEFGALSKCTTAKYVLTAKGPPPTKAPTQSPTKAPTKTPTEQDKCGLFGRGFFCPFKWLFGLFS